MKCLLSMLSTRRIGCLQVLVSIGETHFVGPGKQIIQLLLKTDIHGFQFFLYCNAIEMINGDDLLSILERLVVFNGNVVKSYIG